MKSKLLVLVLLVCASVSAQVNVKSGLIVGAGIGNLYDTHYTALLDYNEVSYKNPDFALGYKIRFQPTQKSFFYDVDIIVGLKRFEQRRPYKYFSEYFGENDPEYVGINHNHTYFQFALDPSFNYRFYGKWYAGIGLSPTVYMAKGRKHDNRVTGYKFDMPASVKLAYDFKYVDVSLGYSLGLFDIAYSDYISKSKMQNLQLQVFIPF
jgi:hypothetical protein